MNEARLAELTDVVTEQTGRLESPAEAVAVLESVGVTDEQAEHMGWPNVFLLGLDVFEHQANDPAARAKQMEVEETLRSEEIESKKPTGLLTFLPRFFAKGFTFGAPMALMLFAILILLYSLWAYFYFDVPRGTAIAVGIVGSYLVTSGFMQAIGRRGLMYLRQDMTRLSLKVTLLITLVALVAIVVSGLLLWLFLELFPVIAPDEVPIAILYFFSLSLLWLGLAIVYMLQQEIWFTVAVGTGIAVVYFLREVLRWPVVMAHQVGILTAAGIGLGVGAILLVLRDLRLKRTRKQPLAGSLPRFSIIVLSVAPYFAYGVAYFGFLFTDRIMAWTGRTAFRQYFVWFQSDYEVGLNWALLSLLFSFGILEFTVYRLGELIPWLSAQHTINRLGGFLREIMSFYRRAVLAYIGSAIIGILVAYFLVRLFIPRFPLIATLFNDVSVYVFVVASISYLCIVWGLLNNVVIFAFSRPSFALRAVVPALVVDLVVGFLLSRMLIYWAAVFGLLAGGLVFWAISTFYAVKMLRDMDYYAYSAF